jgi:hypothetical protein
LSDWLDHDESPGGHSLADGADGAELSGAGAFSMGTFGGGLAGASALGGGAPGAGGLAGKEPPTAGPLAGGPLGEGLSVPPRSRSGPRAAPRLACLRACCRALLPGVANRSTAERRVARQLARSARRPVRGHSGVLVLTGPVCRPNMKLSTRRPLPPMIAPATMATLARLLDRVASTGRATAWRPSSSEPTALGSPAAMPSTEMRTSPHPGGKSSIRPCLHRNSAYAFVGAP